MKALIIIPPRDFRDETVAMANLLLSKWGVTPVIASYTGEGRECIGAHGASYKPQLNATKLTSAGFDALLIVDGPGIDAYKMYELRPLTGLVKDFIDNRKVVGAMGNSVKVVVRSNVLNDRTIAAPRDEEISKQIRLYRGRESPNEMEFDKFLLTAKSNAKLEEFLNTMLEKMGVK